jgi:opacity protein-like surface antigen
MNKIIIAALLLVGSVLSLYANDALEVSVLRIFPNSDNGLVDFEDEFGLSLQWRTDFRDGINFGLEYIYAGASSAEFSGVLTGSEATALNDLFTGAAFAAGATTAKEEYDIHNLFFNVIKGFEMTDDLNLYFSAGVGVSLIGYDVSLTNPGDSFSGGDQDVVLAYQFKLGARYYLNNDWSLNGGVRYLGFSDPSFEVLGVGFDGDMDAIAIDLGLSYHF